MGSQYFISTRTFSIADLLCSWGGVLVFGALACQQGKRYLSSIIDNRPPTQTPPLPRLSALPLLPLIAFPQLPATQAADQLP